MHSVMACVYPTAALSYTDLMRPHCLICVWEILHRSCPVEFSQIQHTILSTLLDELLSDRLSGSLTEAKRKPAKGSHEYVCFQSGQLGVV